MSRPPLLSPTVMSRLNITGKARPWRSSDSPKVAPPSRSEISLLYMRRSAPRLLRDMTCSALSSGIPASSDVASRRLKLANRFALRRKVSVFGGGGSTEPPALIGMEGLCVTLWPDATSWPAATLCADCSRLAGTPAFSVSMF